MGEEVKWQEVWPFSLQVVLELQLTLSPSSIIHWRFSFSPAGTSPGFQDMIQEHALKEPKSLITETFSGQDCYIYLFTIKIGHESAKRHLTRSPEFDSLVLDHIYHHAQSENTLSTRKLRSQPMTVSSIGASQSAWDPKLSAFSVNMWGKKRVYHAMNWLCMYNICVFYLNKWKHSRHWISMNWMNNCTCTFLKIRKFFLSLTFSLLSPNSIEAWCSQPQRR